MLPIDTPFPPGYTNPVIVRAAGALAAAGAWDTTPLEIQCPGASEIVLAFTYTRGGAGGAFDWQSEFSIYADPVTLPPAQAEWSAETLQQMGVLAAGADVQSRVQKEYQTYQATGAAQEAFAYSIPVSKGIERFRLRVRESGNVGAPGSLQVTAKII